MKFAYAAPREGTERRKSDYNSMTERVLYESSNGDTWFLGARSDFQDARREASAEPKLRGQVSYTAIGKFLRDGANGPEHRALR
jgi:hypothetical protein